MAQDPKSKWTTADEATLVEVLLREKNRGNWGDNNPKPSAWTAAESALTGSEMVSGGGPKTVSTIKSRWQRVFLTFLSLRTN